MFKSKYMKDCLKKCERVSVNCVLELLILIRALFWPWNLHTSIFFRLLKCLFAQADAERIDRVKNSVLRPQVTMKLIFSINYQG